LGGLVGGSASVAGILATAGCSKAKKQKKKAEAAGSAEPDLTIPKTVDGHPVIPIIPNEAVANATLMAILTILLPTNGGLPGAIETNVPRTLAGVLSEPKFRGVRGLLEKGAEALNKECLRRHNALFARSSMNIRRTLLANVQTEESSTVPWQSFMGALMDFTIEAYLGHPGRGANPDGVVWEALNVSIEGKPYTRPQNREESG